MKSLVKCLALASALFVLAGAAVVKANEDVNCGAPKCVKPIYISPNTEQVYYAKCTQQGYKVENMVCHKAKGITCADAHGSPDNWHCDCENWDYKTRDTTIDVWCRAE